MCVVRVGVQHSLFSNDCSSVNGSCGCEQDEGQVINIYISSLLGGLAGQADEFLFTCRAGYGTKRNFDLVREAKECASAFKCEGEKRRIHTLRRRAQHRKQWNNHGNI